MWFQQPETFKQYFRCYPISEMKGPDRTHNNYGGKIYVPASALHKLTMLQISYPMMFEIRNEDTGCQTHAGVLEFTAEEGRAYLPQWMMTTLKLKSGSLVKITNVDLELGAFVKIEPQSVKFLDIPDPKTALEQALRNFTTLTIDDVVEIKYKDEVYGIKVLEIKPNNDRNSICVVETDLEVDFAPPVGYVEPSASSKSEAKQQQQQKIQGEMAAQINYNEHVAQAQPKSYTTTAGQSLRGKEVKPEYKPPPVVDASIYSQRDAPALELPHNQLFFGFPVVPLEDDEKEETIPFKGEGFSLRKSSKRKAE